jgi:hypothetical protein
MSDSKNQDHHARSRSSDSGNNLHPRDGQPSQQQDTQLYMYDQQQQIYGQYNEQQGYSQQQRQGYGQYDEQQGYGQQQQQYGPYGQQQYQDGQHFQACEDQQGYRQQQLLPVVSIAPPASNGYDRRQQQRQGSSTPQEHIHPQRETAAPDTRPFCKNYLLDQCKFGTKCRRAHPPGLDATKKEVDFKFDTSVGASCARCCKLLLPVRDPTWHDNSY